MTVLLWILGVLAVPLLAFGLWLAWVFVSTYVRETRGHREAAAEEAAAEIAAEGLAAAGFLPAEKLDTERGMPPRADEEAALEAVRAGDWEVGARWLAAAGMEPEERFQRASALAQLAAEDDAWLKAWQSARAGDADAALVEAQGLVRLAWRIRGAKRAQYTTREQFASFHAVLGRAQAATHLAQRMADPRDGVPYVVEQAIALGLSYSHERYETLWREITARCPRMTTAHFNAVQYWSKKWHGSHERAVAFARSTADGARAGELLAHLPLVAWFEQVTHEDLDADEFFKRPEIVTAVDAALADIGVAQAQDPDSRALWWSRHIVTWVLYWQDRYPEALAQFRAVDGWIGEMPWSYQADPVETYTHMRGYCLARVED
ncbi:hypothetical protein ACN20G_03480 [Streptomyces sp. BI20]|uniref:hypothetical protein n=1 Tax=Streptomyces sp. BI20 TaxID=3403460 RepID=UPI003C735C74